MTKGIKNFMINYFLGKMITIPRGSGQHSLRARNSEPKQPRFQAVQTFYTKPSSSTINPGSTPRGRQGETSSDSETEKYKYFKQLQLLNNYYTITTTVERLCNLSTTYSHGKPSQIDSTGLMYGLVRGEQR